jgi:quinol monooxygenase YgiN
MIVEYLRYEIDEGRQEAFVADYAAATGPLLESPYCRGFELCRCVEQPSSFILRIEWTSAEDHLERFRGSDEFRRFFAPIRPYLGDIREMRHYEQLVASPEARLAIG